MEIQNWRKPSDERLKKFKSRILQEYVGAKNHMIKQSLHQSEKLEIAE